jgi:hypothetical protein
LGSDISSSAPERGLDLIYIRVLQTSIADEATADEIIIHCRFLKTVLSLLAVLSSMLSVHALAALLQRSEHEVASALFPLHSIIDVPNESDMPIRLHHASVRDFLLSSRRCSDTRFYADEKRAHTVLAMRCLVLMDQQLKRDLCDLQDPGMLTEEVKQTLIDACLPSELRYACRYWIEHVERGGHLAAVGKHVAAFLHKHLLHWFEALSLLRLVAEGVKLLTLLGSMPVSILDTFLYTRG